MAAFTSKANGNWSSAGQTTWTQVGVPGNGDTVTMTHAITVDTNTTVGASPFGKPPVAPSASATTGSATTFLPTGTYRIAYSFVSAGGESCMSAEITLAVTRGTSKPRVTLPALPTGVTSISLYLTAAGGAAGAETRFCTAITGTTIDLIGADDGASGSYWENAQGGDGNDAVGGATAQGAAAAPQAVPTAAIVLNSGSAVLTIATGVTLTVRGDVAKSAVGAGIVMNAGSHFQFDASAAATPAAGYYRARATGNNLTTVFFDCNGTSGSHCTITSVTTSSAANGWLTNDGFTGASLLDAVFTDLTHLGGAAYNAVSYFPSQATSICSLVDCTVDSCGPIVQAGSLNAAASNNFLRTLFTNSLGSICINIGGVAAATGTLLVQLCAFDKSVTLGGPNNMTVTDNYFGAGHSTTTGAWTLYDKNLIYTGQDTVVCAGSVSNSYLLHTVADGNAHGFGNTYNPATFTVDGCVFEITYATQGTGDLVFAASGAANPVTTVQNCITLPNASGYSPGKLISPLGWGASTGGSFQALHNTIASTGTNESAVVEYGESGNGKVGMCTALKSNLVWTPAGRAAGAKLERRAGATVVQDAVSAANADYNAGYGLAAGTYTANGYVSGDATAPFSSGTPGAHDVDGQDPQFVDSTRRVATWCTMKGTDGSLAAALALIAANPALIYDAGDATTLIPWVRAGFVPQNQAMKAAHDNVSPTNGWIGAMEGVAAGNPYYAYAQQ